ncbi:MAG: glycine zipper family protein [bacterium]|nr:glycine zipper family protein [bacterium]
MRKSFVLFVLALSILAGLPVMAEAQRSSRYEERFPTRVGAGDAYRRAYPTRQSRYGYDDPRLYDPCFGADQYFEGIRGTFHFNRVNVKDSSGKKVQVVEKHFRACDPTNQPVRMRETAGWYGAGGAVIGYVLGGPKGAAIGGVSGAAIGTIKGDDHKDCFPVDSNHPDLTFGTTAQPTFQKIDETSPVSRVEQGTDFSADQPVAGPAANSGSGSFTLENQTRVYLEAYDGSRYLGRMNPGASMRVDVPQDRYRGYALVPNRKGGLSKDEVGVEPGDDGWAFIEPEVARGRS